MRHIQKRHVGTHQLQRAHANPPTTPHQAKKQWGRFSAHKQAVMQLLLDEPEQYGLCAYSELRADEEGLGYHIEHVRPKSLYPEQTFDYANLVASALTSNDLALLPADEVFAGQHKLEGYDAARFISPLHDDCARYFAYLSDGRVEPAAGLNALDRERARYTIEDLLNLNSPFLVLLRRRWWDELDKLLQDHLDHEDSVYDLACIDLLPTGRRLNRFFTLTRQFYRGIAEQVLTEQAPELL
jgi:uncharacterized protein (TIGR02646 family)